jgi:hypothetical protein
VTITYESDFSIPLQTATTTFEVFIQEECWLTTLTVPSITAGPFLHELYESIQIDFGASTRSEDLLECGNLVYRLKLASDDSLVATGFSIDDDIPAVIGTVTDKNVWVGDFTYYIEAQLGTYNTVASVDFTISISDPCASAVFTSQSLTNMATTVLKTPDVT